MQKVYFNNQMNACDMGNMVHAVNPDGKSFYLYHYVFMYCAMKQMPKNEIAIRGFNNAKYLFHQFYKKSV
jgi:hypothetical protein